MRGLEEWPSSTEFGLQAVCHVAPVPRKRAGAIKFRCEELPIPIARKHISSCGIASPRMDEFFFGLLGMLAEITGELLLEFAGRSTLALLRSKEP
jgi:hypothetical protein